MVCVRGHALVESNVYRHPADPADRQCRTCRRERNAAAYRRGERTR